VSFCGLQSVEKLAEYGQAENLQRLCNGIRVSLDQQAQLVI